MNGLNLYILKLLLVISLSIYSFRGSQLFNLISATRTSLSIICLELSNLHSLTTSWSCNCCWKLSHFKTKLISPLYIKCACKAFQIISWSKYSHFYLEYFRCVQGKVQVARAITQLPFDTICFTGSTTTGRIVAIEAAKNLTPCLL